ncbi:uncharacterized protein F5891DRAFT_1199979 [Suillus fuscotomentosus]|uniref:Nephrocystin 3-like N-terminal domain-containing protein n=1 Tax=Suillus fuscotomentosus TaxID=1912939 RepID=A0AAD4DP06_9AGAM|nr:uncharacterized protein F5891DRAFT_1199979 [Suillus fuscotomentosus]KAG1887429.1 hypothetical protein F5891DRAFT_1199979 [Suillus fuscotomentosus]
MTGDHRPDIDPPRETSRFNQANVVESLNQPRRGPCQFLRKLKNGLTKKLPKRSKRTRNRTTVIHDVAMASSSQQAEDTLHLHPCNDNKHPTTSDIPSDSVNQRLPGEPAPEVQAASSGEEGRPDPQLVDAKLQGARGGTQNMRSLGKHATSVASAIDTGPADLTAADDFETTYLQPLKIIDAVLEKIADVHPYAKMALGALSAASKAQRDQSIISLLKKLAEVYRFMAQDDSLEKFESTCCIVEKILHQTLECARFIRDYSETKSFSTLWTALCNNKSIGTWPSSSNVQTISGDTLDLGDIAYAKGPGLDTMKQCLQGTRTGILSQITDWINGSGDAAQRVLWLSGPAGKGKSAIAHTIANWFKESGGLGSCFCFDRHRETLFFANDSPSTLIDLHQFPDLSHVGD